MANLFDTQLDSELEEVSNIPNLTETNTVLIKEVLAILRSIDEDMDEGYMIGIANRVQIVWTELINTEKIRELSGVTKTRIEEIVRQKNEYIKFMSERPNESKQTLETEEVVHEA